MSRALRLAVRFHEGRYHGHADRFHAADGWPPSPGRLFQALVAAAARGARLLAEDRRALGWLEQLDPPRIAAPPARRGDSVKLFVPNNDLDAVGGDPDRVSEIRTDKQWRPCFFDPDQAVVYVWNFDSGEPEAKRVGSIAARLYQLGRGVDMASAVADILPREQADAALADHAGALYTPGKGGNVACPHPGTLASLVARHEQAQIGTPRKTRSVSCSRSRRRRLSAVSTIAHQRGFCISSCGTGRRSPLVRCDLRPR